MSFKFKKSHSVKPHEIIDTTTTRQRVSDAATLVDTVRGEYFSTDENVHLDTSANAIDGLSNAIEAKYPNANHDIRDMLGLVEGLKGERTLSQELQSDIGRMTVSILLNIDAISAAEQTH